MGSMVVVAVQPVGRHVTHFLQAVEDVAVEHLGSIGLVESFDIGVLRGLAGLDVIEGDTLALSPLGQSSGDEFGAVVQANRQRRTAYLPSSSRARMTRAAGRLVSTSIRRPSRLNSSMTLKVRKRRPDHSTSDMKSQLQPWLG